MGPIAPSLVSPYSFISYMAPSVRLWSPMALFSSYWYNLWTPVGPFGAVGASSGPRWAPGSSLFGPVGL